MTLEGLKELKKRLLEQKKYFIVSNLEELDSSYDVDRFYTAEEIFRLENTRKIASECSKLLEELTYYFATNFDNVSQIALSSMSSPVISKSLLDDKIIDKDNWNKSDQEKIAKYFMDGYVFVSFDASECNTKFKNKELCNTFDKEAYEKICTCLTSIENRYNTTGFVYYDEFIKIIQSLGLTLNFYSKKPANTFGYYKNNCFDFSSLDIIANLDEPKVKTIK